MSAILGVLAGAVASSGGASASNISISDRTVFDITLAPNSAEADYRLTNTGIVQNQNGAALETWVDGSFTASDYAVRVTLSSGTTPDAGALGSWLGLGTSRVWTLTNTVENSTKTSVLLVEIRDVATSTVQDSATITLLARKNSLS